mgnify:CR=1 FL=1
MSEWNAVLYDSKHDFVAEYGKGLLEFVPENKNQSILDLGCGTGTLTVQLSNFADIVIGVDSSASMIAKAKKQYSNMQFVMHLLCHLRSGSMWFSRMQFSIG